MPAYEDTHYGKCDDVDCIICASYREYREAQAQAHLRDREPSEPEQTTLQEL